MIIEDGKGSGKSAFVNPDNRLSVIAQSISVSDAIAFSGMAYSIITGSITLTSTSESGLLYMKNTDQALYLRIDRVILSAGKSTGGTPGNVTFRSYQNPTTGTLISGGSTVTPVNMNFGASLPAQMTALSGVEGSTITNGTQMWGPFVSHDADQPWEFASGILIPVGQAVAFSIQPPAANTSMAATICAIASFIDPNDVL